MSKDAKIRHLKPSSEPKWENLKSKSVVFGAIQKFLLFACP